MQGMQGGGYGARMINGMMQPSFFGGGNGGSRRAPTRDDPRYKTKMCMRWMDTGICSYGDRCNFAHGADDLRTREMNMKCPPVMMAGTNANMMPLGAARMPTSTNNVGVDGREICNDFTKGKCFRGAMCKFSHMLPPTVPMMNPGKKPDATSGTCTSWQDERGFGFIKLDDDSGEELMVFRECIKDPKAQKGEKGAVLVEGAKYSFRIITNERTKRKEASDIMLYDEAAEQKKSEIISNTSDDKEGVAMKRKADANAELCMDYTRGQCFRGNSCKFSHVMPSSSSSSISGMTAGQGGAKRLKTSASNVISAQQLMMNNGVTPMYSVPGGRSSFPMVSPNMSAQQMMMMGSNTSGLPFPSPVPSPAPAQATAATVATKADEKKKQPKGLLLEDEVKIMHSKYPCTVNVDHLGGPKTLFGVDVESVPNYDLQITQRMKLKRGKWLPPKEDRVHLYFSAVHGTDDAKKLERLVNHLKTYKDGRAGVVSIDGDPKKKLHLIPPGKFQTELIKESMPSIEPLEHFLVIGNK